MPEPTYSGFQISLWQSFNRSYSPGLLGPHPALSRRERGNKCPKKVLKGRVTDPSSLLASARIGVSRAKKKSADSRTSSHLRGNDSMASDGCQWPYGYPGPCGCSGTPNSGGSWFLASESPRTLEERCPHVSGCPRKWHLACGETQESRPAGWARRSNPHAKEKKLNYRCREAILLSLDEVKADPSRA